MKDKKKHQNLVDARRHFNIDLSKDRNIRYKDYRIDSEMFYKGIHDGNNTSLETIPENMKNNSSYVDGFNHAKRVLKIQKDLYEMGKKYFLGGMDINKVPKNYINNEYFMQGYNDAKNMEFVDENTIRRNGR